MKTIIMAGALATVLGVVSLSAQTLETRPALTENHSGRFGAGIILGEPTGASLKYWLNDTMAVDGAIGWAFHDETDLHLHSDVLWHKFDVIDVDRGELPFYLGVGGRVKFRDHADDRVGVRLPIGVSYIFDNAPVDVFLEVAPILDFLPSVRGGFTAGIGARFWF